MDALEEWTSENTEKYIRTKNLIKSWKDVASAVGYGNPEGMHCDFSVVKKFILEINILSSKKYFKNLWLYYN